MARTSEGANSEVLSRLPPAAQEFELEKWVLVVPSDLTAANNRWFDEWKQSQRVEISVIDGSELTRKLALPECATARQMLRSWGVIGLPEQVLLRGWIALYGEERFALVANIWLRNDGDRSARGIRAKLQHPETGTVAQDADGISWRRVGGSLNPWELESLRMIHPGESILVHQIPFRELPAGVATFTLRLTGEDIHPVSLSCTFRADRAGLE